MPNAFATGMTWLAAAMQANAATAIVYRRGSATVALTAVKTKTRFEQENPEGQIVATFLTDDYLIVVSELVLEGEQVVPEAGDIIEETVSGVTYQQEITSAGGEPCYLFNDSARYQYRAHTRRIGID